MVEVSEVATVLPKSEARSVGHSVVIVLTRNVKDWIDGKGMRSTITKHGIENQPVWWGLLVQ